LRHLFLTNYKMKSNNLILIGSGDFALEVSDYIAENNKDSSAEELTITDIISLSEDRFDEICSILGYKPIHHKTLTSIKEKDDKSVLVCLGSPETRHKCYQELKKNKFDISTFIHKTALVSNSSTINSGVIVCPYVFIGANSVIEANTVLNVRATIGHDAKIGKSSVISPHANLNGKSKCGDVSFIGAGAIMDPGCSIGDSSKVSSGSIVKGNFGDGFLLSGNPAKGRKMYKVYFNDGTV